MKKLLLLMICFTFSYSISSAEFNQTSGIWTASDTTYAEYSGSGNRTTNFASASKESIVCLAGSAYPRPHNIKKTIDGGKSWTKVFQPNFWYDLLSVAHPNKDIIVVTGDTLFYQGTFDYNDYYKKYGYIAISKDGGLTWEQKVLDSNCFVYCLSMSDEMNGIAIKRPVGNRFYMPANFYDTLLVTTDCWTTYNKVILPDTIKYSNQAIAFSNKDFVVVNYVYNSITKISTGYLNKTNDGGATWSKVELTRGLGSIKFENENIVWAVGSENSPYLTGYFYPIISKSEDGGISWKRKYIQIDTVNYMTYGLTDIYVKGDYGIAVGSGCSIYRTENGGESWFPENLPYFKGLSLRYDYVIACYQPAPDLAFAMFQQFILKYEGNKTLASPIFYRHILRISPDSVLVRWTKVNEAEKYHLQIALDTDGYYDTTKYQTNLILDTIILTNNHIDTIPSYYGIILRNLGYYHCYVARIKAIKDSISSQWEEAAYLFCTFQDSTYIDPPVIISPKANEERESENLRIIWKKSGDNISYDLKIIEPNMGNIINESSNIFDTTYTLPIKLNDNAYYTVQVRVHPYLWKSDWAYVRFKTKLSTDVENNDFRVDLFISPNPASDFIEISGSSVILSEAKDPFIRIFDILGINVTTPTNLTPGPSPTGEGSRVRIDVSHLAPGVYFVRVNNEFKKFIKI